MSTPRRPVDALLGTLVADALAMPAHWYYDRLALKRDYGDLDRCLVPRNPHPDSILWRSSYQALNLRQEILHDQADYWGQCDIHYHQFLAAGEKTLNFQLVRLLYAQVRTIGKHDLDPLLATSQDFMITPGRHGDTYIEESHRAFFTNPARGLPPPGPGPGRTRRLAGTTQRPSSHRMTKEPVWK